MIVCSGVSKRFGDIAAVRELNLSVASGETLALVGPNGSGKTTTLKMALGLVTPSEGRVSVAGVDVALNGCEARRHIGYLPQRLSFPDGCTAREVMHLYARLRSADVNEVATLLERTGLLNDADRSVDGYSGGMRQRLGIAVALLGDPEILILDEPTAALDPSGALLVRDIVRGIEREGKTVLLSSHDLAEVEALAHRIAVFVGGRLAAVGNMDQLSRQVADEERVAVDGRVPLSDLQRSVMQAEGGGRPRLALLSDPVPGVMPLEVIYRSLTRPGRAA